MAGMMTAIFNNSLRAAGRPDIVSRSLSNNFIMTDSERAASRRDVAVLMSESAAARNFTAERAARIATDRG